jgi:hypothetical protein
VRPSLLLTRHQQLDRVWHRPNRGPDRSIVRNLDRLAPLQLLAGVRSSSGRPVACRQALPAAMAFGLQDSPFRPTVPSKIKPLCSGNSLGRPVASPDREPASTPFDSTHEGQDRGWPQAGTRDRSSANREIQPRFERSPAPTIFDCGEHCWRRHRWRRAPTRCCRLATCVAMALRQSARGSRSR